jgi:hypothetical protein
MKRLWVTAGLTTLLCACATPGDPPAQGQGKGAPASPDMADKVGAVVKESRVVETATQPLNDLNLLENRIPPVLTAAAQKGAYAAPADTACAALQGELRSLDAALGPDIDAPAAPGTDPNLVEQAVGFVGQQAIGTVTSTVNTVVDGVIPLRSWVRKLSGAERYSSEVAAAISAGRTRRAFLKGWARASRCEPVVTQNTGATPP